MAVILAVTVELLYSNFEHAARDAVIMNTSNITDTAFFRADCPFVYVFLKRINYNPIY